MNQTLNITQEKLRQAILTVLDYLWQEERKHFLMSQPADRAGHIFEALTVIARWLGETDQAGDD